MLRHHLSPGDVLVMTACVESLHKQYPGQYEVMVETTCPDIWKHNPGVTTFPRNTGRVITMQYPAIHECGSRHVHFMSGFCEHLAKEIGRPVPLKVNRPSIYLSEDENKPLDQVKDIGPYVVINAGYKRGDFTAKFFGTQSWQEVVDRLKGRATFVQVGEKNPGHVHRPLDGAINLIGGTTPRELFRLGKYAAAATGPVSFLLHVSAAFEVPYVCPAGGREQQGWETYETTHYLHTMGLLPCCTGKACWKARVVPLGDGSHHDKSLCQLPVLLSGGEVVPKCLEMIGPEGVISTLERILRGRLGGT